MNVQTKRAALFARQGVRPLPATSVAGRGTNRFDFAWRANEHRMSALRAAKHRALATQALKRLSTIARPAGRSGEEFGLASEQSATTLQIWRR
ncbi:MAG: hypothetical protein ACKVS9_10890 [Phycisphaerae bacterium]